MKTAIKQSFFAIASLLFLNSCFGQTNPPAGNSPVGGKWIVCADTVLKTGYECTNPYSGFEFMADGTYKEYPRTVSDPKQPVLTGKWMLMDSTFTIDQDDTPGTMEVPKTYTIVWVDRNHFYSSNKEGKTGPQMLVYFQRLP